MNRSICTIGTGYVGLTDRVRKLQEGVAPYREAGIEELLQKHLANGRLAFFESLDNATRDADLIVVASVPPYLPATALEVSEC